MTAIVSLQPGSPPGTGTPTGNVAFYTSLQPSLLATVPLNANGVASYTTSSLPAGTVYIQALYQPTGGFLASSSLNVGLEIVALPVATVTVSNPGTITTIQPLNVTITVSGTFGNPTPTGSVTLTSGGYSSGPTALSGGSVIITVPAGSLPVGTDTLTAQYSGDPIYGPATGTGSVVVTLPFAISGTAVSVSAGARSGNQSTITVTPYGGFLGSVVLTASVTSSPNGAIDLPTLSFDTTRIVNITSGTPGTATLTITTVAPVGCTQNANVGSTVRVLFPTSFTLGCILFLARPQREWRRLLPMVVLLIVLVGSVTACGGGGGGTGCTPQSPGTTPGNYVITVTGTSGSVTASGSVSLTVH